MHGVSSSMYRGTGGHDVEDEPGVMFLARVTCTGCHRPPFPGAPTPVGGATFKADPLACIDCHGPGYEGMAKRWQNEVRPTREKVQERIEELGEMLGEDWEGEDADIPEAKRRHEAAAKNLALVMLDRSDGVHNLPYVRKLLAQADEDARAGMKALEGDAPRAIDVGPRVASKQGCTLLCHVGVEDRPLEKARGLPFPHSRHLLRAKLDCSKCHLKEPHGTTVVEQKDCVSCHHQSESPQQCLGCHTDQAGLRKQEVKPAQMADFDCLTCHETIADGHSREAVKETCDGCHDDKEEGYYAAFVESAAAPLREVEAALQGATGDAAAAVRKELADIRRAGPWHNGAYVSSWAKDALQRLK
jgi:hypothetical protein